MARETFLILVQFQTAKGSLAWPEAERSEHNVTLLCLCRVSGYPPFSDERKDMDLPRQIMGGHFSFPKQYWEDVSDDGKQLMSCKLSSYIFSCILQSPSCAWYFRISQKSIKDILETKEQNKKVSMINVRSGLDLKL